MRAPYVFRKRGGAFKRNFFFDVLESTGVVSLQDDPGRSRSATRRSKRWRGCCAGFLGHAYASFALQDSEAALVTALARHSREGGNPASSRSMECKSLDSRFRGN